MSGSVGCEMEFRVRRRGALLGVLGGYVLAFLLIVLGPFLGAAGIGGLGVALAVAMSVALARLERWRHGQVAIDNAGVRFGEHVVPRAAIESAYFAPAAGRLRACVRLLGKRDRFLAQLAVASAPEAEGILGTLGLGVERRTVRFAAFAPLGSTARYVSVLVAILGLGPLVAAIAWQAPWLIAVAFAMFVVGSMFLPCRLHVGADGLWIATRLRPRFVSWAEVNGVELHDRSARLQHGRETTTFPFAATRSFHDRDRVLARAFVTRVTDALSAYRRRATPDVTTRVARNGRTHAEWVAALFDREGSFRIAPVLDEQLWHIVESPSAEASARAGAAAILARTADRAERTRLRFAADACTAPRVRVVLEKAAAGADEAEVEEALRQIDEGEAEARIS